MAHIISSVALVSTNQPPSISLKAGFLDLLSVKTLSFIQSIEIDALPLLFPHDHEDEKRGP